MEILDLLENGSKYFLPNLSVDVVIIGYEEEKLKCLLLKVGEKWTLPGGYIQRDESVETAASRVLMDRAHLHEPHLKFLSVFGSTERKFTEEWKYMLGKKRIEWKPEYWINDRFVTTAFYSLVDIQETHPRPGEYDEAFGWFDFDQLPAMWMDHQSIAEKARYRLKQDVLSEQITYNLLANKFTMPELHMLHQTILEKKLDRSRFQKNMLASGKFERLPMVKKDSPGRNPYQYRFKG